MSRIAAIAPQLLIHLAGAIPLARLAWGLTHAAYFNPVEAMTLQTGNAALIALCVALAISPLRRITGWNDLIKARRPAGLYAFFYGTLHLLIYALFDRRLEFAGVAEDILKRKFITAGMLAWLLMLPLALTSTQRAIRRLGRKWQQLHYLIYPAALAGLIHYWWKIKAVGPQAIAYAAVILGLLGLRLLLRLKK